jgi:hypothetical protein
MLLERDGPGDRERARVFLDAAFETYRELGLQNWAERASELARALEITTPAGR